MEGRYVLELRDRDPATVEDLVLDGCESAEIEGINDKLVNLQSLSMVHVGLQNLKNMPKLPQLSKLDISDNSIAGGLEHVADNCPELLHLNLASNKISKIEDLEPLKKLKLAELDLFNNPVTVGGDGDYRSKIFEMIPSLQILDGADVNGEDVDDSLDGEDGAEEEDSGDESGSDIDGPGLSYLDNTQLDEDESEEYKPGDHIEEQEPKRGLKRRNEETNGEESEAKKKADE
ncbi:leucine Rich repeat-containing domain protein [Dictyocaulus viviparus]|uniref:Leucine Rich repeat-containing domain protein n=1 Tax=Dictyocaulus viviparus TaxID=29172 RepID=A0A0D8YFW8_DICVI|nr:leucine Rich repeat-containing domain protein [Dictyocaulus viviparus]